MVAIYSLEPTRIQSKTILTNKSSHHKSCTILQYVLQPDHLLHRQKAVMYKMVVALLLADVLCV